MPLPRPCVDRLALQRLWIEAIFPLCPPTTTFQLGSACTCPAWVMQVGGSSRPAPQWLICCRALFVVSEARLVMGKEDLGNKITSGAHSGFGEDVPQVRLHGVYGDHQAISDVEGRVTLQHESGQLLLPSGQAVGRHQ